jgi:hypothetical protein
MQPSKADLLFCPVEFEWLAAVVDEIRQAAMEGMFAAPHGGIEIGGVLFGARNGSNVEIQAHLPLECEHAFGPAFALSDGDLVRLERLLKHGWPGLEPVGWYRSSTRGEMGLSGQDLEIYKRYFTHQLDIVLLVKPHPIEPMAAKFFRRTGAGRMEEESCLREITESLPPPREAAEDVPHVLPAPSFVSLAPSPRYWRWAALVLVLIAGFIALRLGRAAAASSVPVSLSAYDRDGQLEIRWDAAAKPVRAARAANVEIIDGALHTRVPLDRPRLASGELTYARQSGRVNVHLRLEKPDGMTCDEFTTFVGPQPAPDAAEISLLREELKSQAARLSHLERTVNAVALQFRREQQRREQQPLPPEQ